eukprot:TRINITY_DN11416_c0_g1_i1.p1 TRINITY_DN11416_c0_g1~~TRINITY_DN11416_c0_g1_i1.p1  ORF type:complete len:670 (-),score=91.69 TRINITY_DN11416_c0_g1_i1:1227-3173(-)
MEAPWAEEGLQQIPHDIFIALVPFCDYKIVSRLEIVCKALSKGKVWDYVKEFSLPEFEAQMPVQTPYGASATEIAALGRAVMENICEKFRRHNWSLKYLFMSDRIMNNSLLRPFINLCKMLAPQLVGIRLCLHEQDSLQVLRLLDPTRLKKLAVYIPFDTSFPLEVCSLAITTVIKRCGRNLTHLKLSGLRVLSDGADNNIELLRTVAEYTGSLESLSITLNDWEMDVTLLDDEDYAKALSGAAQANSGTLRRLLFSGHHRSKKFLKWLVNSDTAWNDFEEMEHLCRTRFAVPLSGLLFGHDLSPWHIVLDGGIDDVKFDRIGLRDLEPLHRKCFPRDAIGERAQSLTTMLSHLRQYLKKNIPDNVRWMREQLRDLVEDATVVYGGLSCRVVRVLETFIALPDNLISDNSGDIKNYALELLKMWIASDKYILKLLNSHTDESAVVLATLFSNKAWIEQHGIDVNTRLTNGSPLVAALLTNVAKAGPLIRHPNFDWFSRTRSGALCLSYFLDSSNSKAFVLALGPAWRQFVANDAVLVACRRAGLIQQLAKFVEFVEFFHWEHLEAEGRDVGLQIATLLWRDLIEAEISETKFIDHARKLHQFFLGKAALAIGFANGTSTWRPSTCPLGEENVKKIIRQVGIVSSLRPF